MTYWRQRPAGGGAGFVATDASLPTPSIKTAPAAAGVLNHQFVSHLKPAALLQSDDSQAIVRTVD
jgi:hypothetical protein